MSGKGGFWFPLVLLGFGLLGLLGWDSVRDSTDFGWFAYTPLDDSGFGFADQHAVVLSSAVYVPSSWLPMRDSSWTVLVIVTLVATIAWYGWRARRAGGSVRPHVAAALTAAVTVPVAYTVVDLAATATDPAGVVTSVGLPLLGLGVLTGGWAYLRRGSRWWRAALAVAVGCLVAGAATVLGAWAPDLLGPLIIAGGLLALARLERSRLLAVVAAALLAAMVAFPLGTLSMLLPATIALAGAVVALVRQPSPTP